MGLRISRAMAEAVRAQARAEAPRECCGLLLGDAASGAVAVLLPAANVAADPIHGFEVDPALLLAAHRAARAGGPALIGHYHSHPRGDPVPSATDAAQARAGGELWLIVGAGGALAAWRAGMGGAVHGRFDPAEIEIVPDTRSCADAPAPALGRAQNH